MDAPQQINVSYYIRILNMIIKGYRMRLDIMSRRNKVIHDYLETFTRDEIRGISDDAFNTNLVNSRSALTEMKRLLGSDRRLIRFIRREEKEEENILKRAIEDLDYAIELLTHKEALPYSRQSEHGREEWDAAMAQRKNLGKRRREAKRRLSEDKVNIHNFIGFCKGARTLFDYIEKNMGDIEHRLQLEESFLNNPNRDTFAIFVKQWREEVKKELELQQSIIIFMRRHKVQVHYDVLRIPVPISVKFAVDIAKRSWPGLFISSIVGSMVSGEAVLFGLIGTIVTATGVAFGDLVNLFDEIRKTAEISSENLITSISKIERKHWWNRVFGYGHV